jgi:toxin FitB
MIVFDTNVISEAVKSDCDAAVLRWLQTCGVESVYTTAVNVAELMAGIESLPEGKRRFDLKSSIEIMLEKAFSGRLLPFDIECANCFGEIVGRMKRIGCAISMADGQIAAIAMVHRFAVATRDTQPFIDAGLPVVNPWLHDQILK